MQVGNLLSKFFGVDWGMVHLRHGEHKIFVPTKVEPGLVFVGMESAGGDGCANDPTNTVSWKTMPDGVDFLFEIGTDTCKAQWVVFAK